MQRSLSPAMFAWLSDVIGPRDCLLLYVKSEFRAADIFTKSFWSGEKFASVRAGGHSCGLARCRQAHLFRRRLCECPQ